MRAASRLTGIAFTSILGLGVASAWGVEFTTNSTITAANRTHEGAVFTVNGCVVTIEGAHAFGAFTVLNAGTAVCDGTNLQATALTVRDNSALRLAGGGALRVTGNLSVLNASTLFVRGANVTGQLDGQWAGRGGTLSAANVDIDATSRITADGEGYAVCKGPGSGVGGGGGSHGGSGSRQDAEVSGPRYGSALQPTTPGTGGGGDPGNNDNSGRGGGAIRLSVTGALTLNGTISANGLPTGQWWNGCGAGGSIWATVGTLTGAGKLTADGGVYDWTNDGGGGRIAVYCDNTAGFSGFASCTAEGRNAQDGTVGFHNAAGHDLRVWQHYIVEPSSTSLWRNVTLQTNAVWELYGGARLAVSSVLTLGSNATLTVHNLNTTGRVAGAWAGLGATVAAQTLDVTRTAKITADGEGYGVCRGPGIGTGGGGGSHGGSGAWQDAEVSGPRYGSALQPTTPGTGGGGDPGNNDNTGRGGGAMRLVVAGTLILDGTISANGLPTGQWWNGCGAGGSIWATAGTLTGAGRLKADGGVYDWHNDGGGGRIAVYCDNTTGFSGFASCTAEGRNAQDGTVGFYNVAGSDLRVWHHYIVEPSVTSAWGNVTLETNAVFELGGAAWLQVTNALTLGSNATLTVHSLNVTGRVAGAWAAVGSTIAAQTLTLTRTARVSADREGYWPLQGPGVGGGGSGSSHGGSGCTEGSEVAGPRYGSALQPTTPGSGGGAWVASDGPRARGGGALRLSVGGTLTLDGEISADGGTADPYYTGCGSGGSIWATLGALAGSGRFTADGGIYNNSWNDGGGGRIAVYCDNTSAYTGFALCTAEGRNGQDGTVGFHNAAGNDLRVWHHYIVEPAVTSSWRTVTLQTNAVWELYGGAKLAVSNALTLGSNVTVTVHNLNVTGRVDGAWAGLGATIAARDLTVTRTAKISADSEGYCPFQGPGVGVGGGGSSHGGSGCTEGSDVAGPRYGSALQPAAPGSGGGAWVTGDNPQARGGGAIRLIVGGAMTLDGEVTADGGTASPHYTGCGSGGSIWATLGTLTGSGRFTADGGIYNNSWNDGGGGRIAVYCDNTSAYTGFALCTAEGRNGQDGTVGFHNAAGNDLRVWHHYIVEPAVTSAWRTVTLQTNAVWELYGGARLDVATTLTLGSNVTLTVHNLNVTGRVDGAWSGVGSTISAQNLNVTPTARITANGEGYLFGRGPGVGTGGSGGSHGGSGAWQDTEVPGARYGSALQPTTLGSGGAGDMAVGAARGGGAIRLAVSGTLTLNGAVMANGGVAGQHYTGCGAGGSIWATLGQLTGAGKFTADGGLYDWHNDGGGGRIAVYCDDIAGFSGMRLCTAEGRNAQDGTVIFMNRAGDAVNIWHHFVVEPSTTSSWHNLTLQSNAVIEVYGGAKLAVAGLLRIGRATVTLHSLNVTGRVDGEWAARGATIEAQDLTLDAGGVISADREGYYPLQGPGVGTGECGASHGGSGAVESPEVAAPRYGSALEPTTLGSGGAAWDATRGATARGGGAIRLVVVGTFTLNGEVTADGGGASPWYTGCGSGGSIWATLGHLAGAGKFTADGGLYDWHNDGGGGRIAVYCDDTTAYTGYALCTAEGRNAQDGTVGFFDAAGNDLRIWHHYMVEPSSTSTWTRVTLQTNAVFELYGAARLGVTDTLTVLSNAQITVHNLSVTGWVDGAWAGEAPSLKAGNLVLRVGGRIHADGEGYWMGQGPGTGTGNGGASYGGLGGSSGNGTAGATYGVAELPSQPGSGGLANNATPRGGGAVRLVVPGALTLDGTISANGLRATEWWHGCGSGGSIWVDAGTLSGAGRITANGGAYEWYNSGGGGRIAVYCWTPSAFAASNLVVNGAARGSAILTTGRHFAWTEPAGDVWHGVETLGWGGAGFDPDQALVSIVAHRQGVQTPIAHDCAYAGRVAWNTAASPDGWYQLKGSFYDRSGVWFGDCSRDVLVQNAAVWHTGTATNSATWLAGATHLVLGTFSVASNATVTVEAGAVVKFLDGARITVRKGGTLSALGTPGAATVFTALADDTAGGDANLDGSKSVPRPGSWGGVNTESAGAFLSNEHTDLRYQTTSHGGILAGDETWRGTFVHAVTNDVTVPSGVTLRIEPGAIVKFAPRRRILVAGGGALVADGLLARPITFTSVRDDACGGDLNGDGSLTAPAAGDWRGLHVDGGRAALNHAFLLYGGNSGSGTGWDDTAAAIRTSPGGIVSVSNSVIRNAFFDAVIAWGGGQVDLVNSVIAECDRGVNPDSGSLVRLRNCTLYKNRVGIWCHGGTVAVTNTLITHSFDAGINRILGSPITVDHGDVWSTTGSAYVNMADQAGLNGNISANPLYRNADAGNYQLAFRSPAVDAANGPGAPTRDYMGVTRYDDPRTVNTGTPATGGLYADMGAFELVEDAASPLDLVGDAVVGPAHATAGSRVDVSWTVVNRGTASVRGPWHDAVALVGERAVLPAGEVLVGEGQTLGPGGRLTMTAKVSVPGGTPGAYRWRVDVNAGGEVFEGRNRSNNLALAATDMRLEVPATTVNGGVAGGRFEGAGTEAWFRIDPTGGANLLVSLNLLAARGATELFVGRGYMPTRDRFDLRQSQWNTPDVDVVITDAAAEPYYVLVVARSLPEGASDFELRVDTLAFALRSVEPSLVGNSGPVTLTVRGSGFDAQTVFELLGAGGPRATQGVVVQDPATVYATFDTTGLLGSYNLRASGRTGVAALTNAVLVVARTQARLAYALSTPAAMRPGRTGRIVLTYKQEGGGNAVAPLLAVRARGGTFRLLSVSGQAAGPEWETGRSQALLLGINPQGDAGVLPPGALGTIELELTPLRGFGECTVEVRGCGSANPQMGWADHKADMRPIGIPADAWDVIFARFVEGVGSTVQDLNLALAGDASLYARVGDRVFDIEKLLVQRFLRCGLWHISRNYALGAFGRGQAAAWELRAMEKANGSVAVVLGGCTIHFFTRETDGSYRGPASDRATLVREGAGWRLVLPDGSGCGFGGDGQVLDLADPRGNRTTCQYVGGRIVGLVDPDGDVTQWDYNAAGRIVRVVGPTGREARCEYDAGGQQLVRLMYPGVTNVFTYVTGQQPGNEHALQSAWRSDGSCDYYAYDDRGRLVRTWREGGAGELRAAYDAIGGITVSDAGQGQWRLAFDADSCPVRIANALGQSEQYGYNDRLDITSQILPEGHAYRFEPDATGNPAYTVNPLQEQTVARFRDGRDWLEQFTDAEGNTTRFTLDASGNVQTVETPSGNRRELNSNGRGLLTAWRDADGNTVRYEYDAHDALVALRASDGEEARYAYDGQRQLVLMSNASLRTSLAWDAVGRVRQLTDSRGRFLRYTYDAQGRRAGLNDQSGFGVQYGYDTLGRLATVTGPGNAVLVRYAYDGDGRVQRKDLGNGTATLYAYDAAGRVTNQTDVAAGGGTLARRSYVYDARGLPVEVAEDAGIWHYQYDGLGQLTAIAPPAGPGMQVAYDRAGSRRQVTVGGVTTRYVTGSDNRYVAAGAGRYEYDRTGNVRLGADGAATWRYTYTPLGRLASLEGPDGLAVNAYDAMGDRVACTRAGERREYQIDPVGWGNIVAEYDGAGAVVARYVYGPHLICRIAPSGAVDYYHFDAQGNTRMLTDAGGAVLNRYAYEPFGALASVQEAVPNRFRFGGEFGVIWETGSLYCMRARYYDGNLGRFLQPDPLGTPGRFNTYDYACNNPLTGVDPNGEFAIAIPYAIKFGITAVIMVRALYEPYNQAVKNTESSYAYATTPYPFMTLVADPIYGKGYRNLPPVGQHIIDLHEGVHGGINPLCWLTERKAHMESIRECRQILQERRFNGRPITEPEREALIGLYRESAVFLREEVWWPGNISDADLQRLLADVNALATLPLITSADPNDLIGPAGSGSNRWIQAEQLLPYTIHFENMATAAVPAQVVFVTHQLNTNLDWSTFSFDQFGFGGKVFDVPAGLQTYRTLVNDRATTGLDVEFKAALDADTGIVRWEFVSLDPNTGRLTDDPFAGFLPPNVTKPEGDGFVSYTVRGKTNLLTGARIDAEATIVFDVNDPIDTPHVFNTADQDAPSSTVRLLPARSATRMAVSWGGADQGSGIGGYDIYVAVDGGAYRPWLVGTTNTLGVYNGEAGHGYAFFCVAYDAAGRSEALPPAPDATTLAVASVCAFSGLQAGGAQTILELKDLLPGVQYVVERRATLVGSGWLEVERFTADAETLTRSVVQPEGGRWFYRLRVGP